MENEKSFTEYQLMLKDKLNELDKLQHLKSRVFDISAELETMSTRLIELSKVLSPNSSSLKIGNKKPRNQETKDIENELYATMQSGTHVTRKLIQKTYPDLQNYDYNNLLSRLKIRQDVKSAKDGGVVRLYI
jgi:hypothetical protein